MRIGEVCGLRWCDVDFETGLISIRHSVAYAKGMGSFIKDTKTHDARGIPIDPVGLLPFLKETHEIDCGKLRLRGLTGAVEIGDCYILSEPGATFATTSYIRRAFKTFSETNGLMGTNDELITFHGLRHTFATQWIRQGGDIKALQSILGHKDAMATLNVYADIEPISNIEGINFAYLKKSSIYIVATTRFNVSPSFVLELLNRVVIIIKDFLGQISEEMIRKNFVLVYEILDEIIDFGHPQLTNTSLIKPLIASEVV